MSYTKEPWFAILVQQCASHKQQRVADLLGVSAPTVSQVLKSTGKYGRGEASTDKLAEKVIHTFGKYPCPHLSEQAGFGDEAVVITAEECRGYAHRPAPTGSPRDMQHWQACNACKHKEHSAPPQPREVKPRKAKPDPTTQEIS